MSKKANKFLNNPWTKTRIKKK